MSTAIDPRLVEVLREATQELEKAEKDRRRAEVLRQLRSAQVALLDEHKRQLLILQS